jgi:hypothetical protein
MLGVMGRRVDAGEPGNTNAPGTFFRTRDGADGMATRSGTLAPQGTFTATHTTHDTVDGTD